MKTTPSLCCDHIPPECGCSECCTACPAPPPSPPPPFPPSCQSTCRYPKDTMTSPSKCSFIGYVLSKSLPEIIETLNCGTCHDCDSLSKARISANEQQMEFELNSLLPASSQVNEGCKISVDASNQAIDLVGQLCISSGTDSTQGSFSTTILNSHTVDDKTYCQCGTGPICNPAYPENSFHTVTYGTENEHMYYTLPGICIVQMPQTDQYYLPIKQHFTSLNSIITGGM